MLVLAAFGRLASVVSSRSLKLNTFPEAINQVGLAESDLHIFFSSNKSLVTLARFLQQLRAAQERAEPLASRGPSADRAGRVRSSGAAPERDAGASIGFLSVIPKLRFN